MDNIGHLLLIVVLPSAFVLDLLIGDPPSPLHPVRLIGKLISSLEKTLHRIDLRGIGGGFILLCLAIIIPVLVYSLLRNLIIPFSPVAAIILDTLLLYACIALRDMRDHIMPVVKHLKNENINNARASLSKIVGRDTAILDKNGIARATVETVAESFVDGFLAPVFWFFVIAATAHSPFSAAIAALIYRTVNTLDSMVGHHTTEYEYFGKPSAISDDILNFIPARISVLFLMISSFLLRYNTKEGIRIFFRDRLKHQSPNSAHAESFTAGALELRLGGPTIYDGEVINKPFIGGGSIYADAIHVIKAVRLSFYAGLISVVIAELFIVFSVFIFRVIKS